MNIIQFFKQESEVQTNQIILITLISAISESFVLGIIIAVANTASFGELNFRLLMMYGVAVAIAVYGKRYTLMQSATATENMIRKIRMRMSDKLRKCDLLFLENIGIGEIYTKITTNTNLISAFILLLIAAIQSVILVIFCMFYIATLSKLAFVITSIAMAAIVYMYMYHDKIFSADYDKAIFLESQFCDMLNDTLNGFKELKLNQNRNIDHLEFFKKIVYESEAVNIKTQTSFATKSIFTQLSFYCLLAGIGFLMPRLGQGQSELIIRIVAAILFLIGPINIVITAIPNFFRINASINTLYNLENTIENASKPEQKVIIKPFDDFKEIRFEDITFQYRDEDNNPSFALGPLNLSINKGEILFIVGGNGTGKSTLLKLLTALYYPSSGTIKIDEKCLSQEHYPQFRELFSAIFSDFHLFHRLYGFRSIDYEKIYELLTIMNLENKTEVVDGWFTNIKLSTGQQKRIAMLVALLENRQVYVFDEWAADQDPKFKKYFYEKLLKDLKDQGKTVIAVSHDDRYFHAADRVIKMEFGRFIEESSSINAK